MNIRAFVPVCLYARSGYRRKRYTRNVMTQLVAKEADVLWLVCDDLHAHNLYISHKFKTFGDCLLSARRQAENLIRMHENTRSEVGLERIEIKRWLDIAITEPYQRISRSIERYLQQDHEMQEIVTGFARSHLSRLQWKPPADALEHELLYVKSEISMSIYCTEVLDYNVEIWDNVSADNPFDPLQYLFCERSEVLRGILAKRELARELRFVNDL